MSVSSKSWVIVAGLLGCGALALARADQAPRLVFNATASAPTGFYAVTPGRFAESDLVVVVPPPPLARWMAARGYLPANVPLMKTLAAGEGRHVCARDDQVLVHGAPLARMRSRDALGRSLPKFRACRRLEVGEVLLINAAADSLDGRYFGPLPASTIVGRARPLWTWGKRR